MAGRIGLTLWVHRKAVDRVRSKMTHALSFNESCKRLLAECHQKFPKVLDFLKNAEDQWWDRPISRTDRDEGVVQQIYIDFSTKRDRAIFRQRMKEMQIRVHQKLGRQISQHSFVAGVFCAWSEGAVELMLAAA